MSPPVQADKVCVIVNPTAGRDRGAAGLDFGPGSTVRRTDRPGQAEEIAFEAATAGCTRLIAVGGDGTVHEAANGLLRAGRPEVVFQVVPAGSANDFAHSLAWQHADAAAPRPVDVGLARRPDGRERFFINCLGLGFNGAVTRQARRIRWLRGVPLYTLALLRALCREFEAPPMTITLDGRAETVPTLSLTLGNGRREGNFLITPDARVDDGWLDYLHAGALRRWELLRHLPGMITGRLPTNHPQLRRGRCRQMRVESATPLTVHLDGEFFCVPEDGVLVLEVEIRPGALRACVFDSRVK